MKLSEQVRDVLGECTIEGNLLYLPNQLDRNVYLAVNKVIESLGGKWNRKQKAHVFEASPEDAIEMAILTGEYTDAKKDFQFFETPEALADKLCEMAEIDSDSWVLEPSAGRGRIADAILKYNPEKLLLIELNQEMEKYLTDKPYTYTFTDFLKLPDMVLADRIVMNPPFSKQQDIDHVYKAFQVLKPGGIMVAVMSCSVLFRSNRKSVEFRNFLDANEAYIERLPEDTFKESGTMVHTCVIKIRKAGECE